MPKIQRYVREFGIQRDAQNKPRPLDMRLHQASVKLSSMVVVLETRITLPLQRHAQERAAPLVSYLYHSIPTTPRN